MDYCLVLQNDETGKQRGLCWAATCATMIRYSTGNRSIESFQIANEMGIDMMWVLISSQCDKFLLIMDVPFNIKP